MKTIIAILLFALSAFAEDLKLENGTVMKNVTINRVEPNGLSVMTEEGIVKVKFSELPEELRKKYGYDPANAAQFEKSIADAARARDQKARLMQTVAEVNTSLDKLAKKMDLQITQVTKDGALCGSVFIYGLSEGMADRDWWSGTVYPAGFYEYTTVLGASKKIRAYAISKEMAVAIMTK